jgi:DNA topoisomerase-1
MMFGGGKPQWTVLKHNGPMFPPPYKPHKIPVIINGKEVVLPEQTEEYATMFAKFIDTQYLENKFPDHNIKHIIENYTMEAVLIIVNI